MKVAPDAVTSSELCLDRIYARGSAHFSDISRIVHPLPALVSGDGDGNPETDDSVASDSKAKDSRVKALV